MRAGLQREVCASSKEAGEEPLLLAKFKPGRPYQFYWKSSCETWSVSFSPDGSWFAWSQGHCIVKLIPWPLEERFIPKGFEAKSRSSKNDTKGRGSPKEKTLDCGQIVWALAFSPWPSPPSRKLGARHHPQVPDISCLILATGLNDGQIKIGRCYRATYGGFTAAPSPPTAVGCALQLERSRSFYGAQIRKLEGPQSSVVSCDFSPDSALLITTSYDTNVIM
ncbi:WD repeat and SOCS box-containing protein 2 [Sciurus carolinensis]|uniref:WD repeat and SOCS box-containing protein 2 n=1 Tax=Sciurus carolinensis TaxID=30640 RepID=A0AA41N7W2_SCICA|nr:WD repeat and SOCS box-containing protein 2 [Sciurus carolinensis]